MGINGLLKALHPLSSDVHVSEYANQRVGVDAYVWLHKGAFSCSTEICLSLPADRHVKYCMKRVNLLKHHGVIPVMVFDGAKLPSKDGTELSRGSSRETNMKDGLKALQQGPDEIIHYP